MKIQINEVWNAEGKSVELAVIEKPAGKTPLRAVWDWININRPDLNIAGDVWAHGFHAKEVA